MRALELGIKDPCWLHALMDRTSLNCAAVTGKLGITKVWEGVSCVQWWSLSLWAVGARKEVQLWSCDANTALHITWCISLQFLVKLHFKNVFRGYVNFVIKL